jgi:hypothetical protein
LGLQAPARSESISRQPSTTAVVDTPRCAGANTPLVVLYAS